MNKFTKVFAGLVLVFALVLGAGWLTARAEAATIFSADFESGDFSAWTTGATQHWTVDAAAAYAGTYGLGVSGPTGGDEFIVKMIDTTGYQNLDLNLWYQAPVALEAGDQVAIEYTTDGGATWQNANTYDQDFPGHAVWDEITIPLTALNAAVNNNPQFGLRFRATLDEATDQMFFDDLNLVGEEMAATPAPALTGLFVDLFDSGDLAAWTAAAGWSADAVPGARHSGAGGLTIVGPAAATTDTLTKMIDASGYQNLELAYWFRVRGTLEDADRVDIEYTTDGGATWQNLTAYNSSALVAGDVLWTDQTAIFPAGANNNPNFGLRFTATLDEATDGLSFDELVVRGEEITTPPAALSGLFTEDFELANLDKWLTTGVWQTSAAPGARHSGAGGLTIAGPATETTLTKMISTAGYQNLELGLWHRLQADFGAGDEVAIEYTTDGGATWQNANTYDQNFFGPGETAWSDLTVPFLSAAANNNPNFGFRFRANLAATGGRMAFDDFSLIGEVLPPTPPPVVDNNNNNNNNNNGGGGGGGSSGGGRRRPAATGQVLGAATFNPATLSPTERAELVKSLATQLLALLQQLYSILLARSAGSLN